MLMASDADCLSLASGAIVAWTETTPDGPEIYFRQLKQLLHFFPHLRPGIPFIGAGGNHHEA